MHRCYIDPSGWCEDRIIPPDAEAHHLMHVMRATDGTRVKVFDGQGREAEALVQTVAGRPRLIIQSVRNVADPAFDTSLIIALPKGPRAELVFEKATELGVSRIIPVISRRSVMRVKDSHAEKKAGRWRRICESAAKQCGTPRLPLVEPVVAYRDVIRRLREFDAVLLGSLEDCAQPLKTVIAELQQKQIGSIAVIIGPEGDLTPEETAAAIDSGALPVSFGDLTLRAETAAIFALSILAYEFMHKTFE